MLLHPFELFFQKRTNKCKFNASYNLVIFCYKKYIYLVIYPNWGFFFLLNFKLVMLQYLPIQLCSEIKIYTYVMHLKKYTHDNKRTGLSPFTRWTWSEPVLLTSLAWGEPRWAEPGLSLTQERSLAGLQTSLACWQC